MREDLVRYTLNISVADIFKFLVRNETDLSWSYSFSKVFVPV